MGIIVRQWRGNRKAGSEIKQVQGAVPVRKDSQGGLLNGSVKGVMEAAVGLVETAEAGLLEVEAGLLEARVVSIDRRRNMCMGRKPCCPLHQRAGHEEWFGIWRLIAR